MLNFNFKSFKIKTNPWQYLVLSFCLLIAFGTGLLLMPFVHHTQNLHFVDALFMSTSAVCVTGLATVPTSGFNIAGQLSLLLLMQLGAIGIMTLTSSFLISLKGNLKLKHRLNFSKLQDNYDLHDANYILKNIVKITLVTELIGAIFLSIGFLLEGLPFGSAIYQGFFHAISAFCNAGFSTYDSSIMGLNPLIKYTVSILITIGGIGYFVLFELLENRKNKRKLSLHTKIVLISSVALMVLGTVFLYIFEQGNMSITDSFFQSVTTRTAGFNSVDLTKLHMPSIFLMLILMFIGASPGSTGGGIKTTNFFVIVFSVITVLKGGTKVVLFNRTISYRYILKAFATAMIYFVVISVGVVLLLQDDNVRFEEAIFECVSAMGTVGLSLGITPYFSEMGKLIIVALMFIGRLGPSSFAMATLLQEKQVRIQYPEGTIY